MYPLRLILSQQRPHEDGHQDSLSEHNVLSLNGILLTPPYQKFNRQPRYSVRAIGILVAPLAMLSSRRAFTSPNVTTARDSLFSGRMGTHAGNETMPESACGHKVSTPTLPALPPAKSSTG